MKEIHLSNGGVAIVDEEDFEILNKWRWVRNNMGYAQRGIRVHGISSTQLMHRLIMKAQKGQVIDHKNHTPLDNRKVNLRLCTQKQNTASRVIHKNNTSGHKGVQEINKRWRAMIQIDKNVHLGMYDTKEEAALAYDCAAIQVFGEYAWLNIL